MYRVEEKEKNRRGRRILWLVIVLIGVGLLVWAGYNFIHNLKPKTLIKQSAVVKTVANTNDQNKTYEERDFTITLPSSWVAQPTFVAPYLNYTWKSSDTDNDGEVIAVYEDSGLVNTPVNRELVVQGQTTQLSVVGTVSDNCVNFTRGSNLPNSTGVPAEWQGVDFLCDRLNTTRNLVGTGSTDGVNTVILKTSHGVSHSFFFTFEDYSSDPNYTDFENALQSFAMR